MALDEGTGQARRRACADRDEEGVFLRLALELLVGLKLASVRYLVKSGERPPFDAIGADVDHIDYGLELVDVHGQVIGVSFNEISLWIEEGELAYWREADRVEAVDVSTESRWTRLLGREVTDARVLRAEHRVFANEAGKRWAHIAVHPTLEIQFGEDNVWVSVIGMTDAGAIAFDEKAAIRIL